MYRTGWCCYEVFIFIFITTRDLRDLIIFHFGPPIERKPDTPERPHYFPGRKKNLIYKAAPAPHRPTPTAASQSPTEKPSAHIFRLKWFSKPAVTCLNPCPVRVLGSMVLQGRFQTRKTESRVRALSSIKFVAGGTVAGRPKARRNWFNWIRVPPPSPTPRWLDPMDKPMMLFAFFRG